MLSITAMVTRGENPYTYENQPVRAVVYPVLYNIIVAPLSSVFGNSLPLHRTVAGLFILMACAFCYVIARRQTNSRKESFAMAALWYAALLYYTTPVSSPNSLGVLLFIASVSIPWLYNFSSRSLCVALALGILAFFSKQYFVACLGYIALYLFIGVSKRTGLLFGIASLILLLLTLGLVNYTSPYFLDNTFFSVRYIAGQVSSYETAFKQLLEFGQINLPLLIILLLEVARKLVGQDSVLETVAAAGPPQVKQGLINPFDMDAPLINTGVNYFWFCFTCSLLVIVFAIGKSPGNHLTYLFQIMSPFLFIGCFQRIAKSRSFKPLYYLLLIATFYSHYSMLSHDFSVNEKNWQRIKQLMSEADDIFASTIVLAEVIREDKEVYENGHTRYFYYAEEKPQFFAQSKPEETITNIWSKHVNRIHAKIEAQEFDLILLDPWLQLPTPSPRSTIKLDAQVMLRKYYYRSEVIVLNLANRPGGGAYEMQVWKPILEAPVKQEPRPPD
jgi:uncharacterized membrane protein YvlD (DUF360 family)